MKSPIRLLAFAAVAIVMSHLPAPSHAELIDNGDGLIYDTVLDITWAQPFTASVLRFDDANFYVQNLFLGGVSGWRLPYISVAAGTGPLVLGAIGCDRVDEPTCRDNELGYMWYWNFGARPGDSVPPNGDPDVLALFRGLLAENYHSGTEYDADNNWRFGTFNGRQGPALKEVSAYVWPVHDGNVGSDIIFADGFESGDTSAWSSTVP